MTTATIDIDKTIPATLNLAIGAGFVLLHVVALYLLPLTLAAQSGWWALLLVPVVLTSNSLWFWLHESFHQNLHPNKHVNEHVARTVACFFPAPYAVVRFGHLMHHRFNGAYFDRPDVHPDRASGVLATIDYYWKVTIGLYVAEVLAYLPFIAGRGVVERGVDRFFAASDESDDTEAQVGALAKKMLATDQTVAKVRTEAAGAALIWGFALLAWGSVGMWWVVPLFMLGRGFLISFANNLPHYATTNHDVKFGMNLAMPRALNLFYLNFYCHHVHHINPTIPWVALPTAMAAMGETWHDDYFRAAAAQFGGPFSQSELDRTVGEHTSA